MELKAKGALHPENSVRVLTCLFLPNTRQTERFTRFDPTKIRDPRRPSDILWNHGVFVLPSDLNRFPLNPFAKAGTFYAGFDPARAFTILLCRRHVDVVVPVFESTAFFLVMLRRLFFFRPKIVLLEVSPLGWRPRDLVRRYVVPRVDHVVTLTAHSRDALLRAHNRIPPVSVLTAGVDEAFYSPISAVPTVDVLAVGEDQSRDFGTLLEACRGLACSITLKTRRRLDIPAEMRGRVTVIRERLSDVELRALYATARIVCLPLAPTENPGGISTLLEAMAMGKPIVASDHGTVRDHLIDGRDGLVVPAGEPVAMRSAIARLLAEPAFAASLGAAARRHVLSDFSMPVRNAKLAQLLRRVAGAPEWPATAP